MMNDLWKMWRFVTPREGIMAVAATLLLALFVHAMVMSLSDRYATALLG